MSTAMEYTEVSAEQAEHILTSPEWVMQQKFDGTRALITVPYGTVTTRKGTPLKFAAARNVVGQVVKELRRAYVYAGNPLSQRLGTLMLDGEIMPQTGNFHVFDIVPSKETGLTYAERLKLLDDLRLSTHVKRVRTIRGEAQKRGFLAHLQARGVEGAMFKRLDNVYEPGKRSTSAVKVKFVKSADVVVLATTQSPMSATLGTHIDAATNDGRTMAVVGSCSLIGKQVPPAGAVVEVEYLYWTGTKMIQPRLKRLRMDKSPEDSHIDQFPMYSREPVE